MSNRNQTFTKEEIQMDFNHFIECNFVDCNLVYHGFGPIGMEGCSFTDSRWTFADAAANTVQFMASLYHGAGEGGQKLIDATFENIKAGRPFGQYITGT